MDRQFVLFILFFSLLVTCDFDALLPKEAYTRYQTVRIERMALEDHVDESAEEIRRFAADVAVELERSRRDVERMKATIRTLEAERARLREELR